MFALIVVFGDCLIDVEFGFMGEEDSYSRSRYFCLFIMMNGRAGPNNDAVGIGDGLSSLDVGDDVSDLVVGARAGKVGEGLDVGDLGFREKETSEGALRWGR